MPLDQLAFDPNEDRAIPLKYFSERHVACVFLLDTSNSMQGDPIAKLNAGLKRFKEQTLSNPAFDEHAKSCIDVALVTFDSEVKVIQDFVPVEQMQTPILTVKGMTKMGEALEKAMDMVTQQKIRYNRFGVPYFRPWIFCITDGGPNDNYLDAITRLEKLENERKVLAYCVGVNNFRKDIMRQIFSPERIFELEDCDFPALFEFVSNSLAAVRNSTEANGGVIDVDAPKKLRMVF